MAQEKYIFGFWLKSLNLILFFTLIMSGRLYSGNDRYPISLNESSLANKVNQNGRNQAPEIIREIREWYVAADDSFDLYLPRPVFTDPDGDTLFVSATLSDGSSLPDWIHFTDTGTGTGYFTGIAPENGSVDITVTAADPGGLEASSTLKLNIVNEIRCNDFLNFAEEMPELIGGLASLQENVRYTADALTTGIEGRVVVQFFVGPDGKVYNPQIQRGIDEDLDKEALRVLRHVNFIPGYQRGEAVCVQYSLPIVFKLGDHTQTESLILNPVNDQEIVSGESFIIPIPDDTFVDPQMDLGSLQAYTTGYGNLPGWLSFNSDSDGGGTFEGTAPAPDTLTIELKPENLDVYHPFQIYIREKVSVSRESEETTNPNKILLHHNYPNPFNPVTTIRFDLPEPGIVDLSVYDSAGRLVEQLIAGHLSSGAHIVSFNGSKLSSGLYHYSLNSGNTSVIRTMTLIK